MQVHAAFEIDTEQVAVLMKLAMDNGEATDIYNLASCTSASELETEFVLEVGWLLGSDACNSKSGKS
jgi:hypothetical protein